VTPREAFELGWLSSSPGFFFDGMEVVAAAAPIAGGLERLTGAVALLQAEAPAGFDRLDRARELVSAAFGRVWELPRGVDAYRLFLTAGVFEIVNRWSYLSDIRQVTRLQAWFYCGFGLGRADAVLLALPLLERVREVIGVAGPVETMPDSLQRLLAEAISQVEVPAREADFDALRPLLLDTADRLKPVAVRLLRAAPDIAADPGDADLRRRIDECVRRVRFEVPGGVVVPR
jgi:hypothetical protein